MDQASNTEGAGKYPLWPPGFARHRGLLAALFGVAVVLAVAVAFMGWLGLWGVCAIFSAPCIIFGFLPTLILTLVWWRTRRRILSHLAAISAAILVFLILLIPANVAGYALARWQLRRSMRLSDVIASQLDAYKERHGAYPDSIQKLAEPGVRVRLPRLARQDFYYVSADRKSFSLTIPDPTGSVKGTVPLFHS